MLRGEFLTLWIPVGGGRRCNRPTGLLIRVSCNEEGMHGESTCSSLREYEVDLKKPTSSYSNWQSS